MDRKQKEALVIALSEKGKTYREITKEARSVSKHDQGYFEQSRSRPDYFDIL